MDPLSIVASAITLVEATSVITKSLYGLIKSLQTADSRLSTLHNDLQTLTRFLNSIKRTLNGCRNSPLALAAVEEDMWLQCRVTLEDCQNTLNDIGALVQEIDASSRSGGFLRRAKLAVNLSLHDGDLTAFKDKLHKSNWALQTVLGVLNVSLSLRNSASQDLILAELDRLKSSIDHALRAATAANEDRFTPLQRDADFTQNLRNLVRAARQFHTTASTTATTIQDTQERATWALRSDAPLSLAGDLPPFRRQRVEHFIENNQAPSRRSILRFGDDAFNEVRDFVGTEAFLGHDDDADYVDNEGDEEEHELLFLQGLEELAMENIIHHDFAKAEVALEQAFQRHTGSASMAGLFQNLQLQLTLCYFFQHKWQLAEPLVLAMVKTRPDITIFNLFHAIALAYVYEFSFEPALKFCKHALHSKKRLVGDSHNEYQETLGLLTMIYDIKGEPIWAEVFRRKIQPDFVYAHPPSEVDFICRHPTLLRSVFGDTFPSTWAPLPGNSSPVNLEHDTSGPDEISPSNDYTALCPPEPPVHLLRVRPSIRHRVNASAKRDLDTQKEVVCMIPDTPISPSVQVTCPETAEVVGVNQGALSDDETQARSITRKLNRMLGTIKVRRGRSHGAITEIRESGVLGSQDAAVSKATSMFDLRRRAKAMRGKTSAADTVYLNHTLDDSRLPNPNLVEIKYPVELMDTSAVSGPSSEDPAPSSSAQGHEASGSSSDDARLRSSVLQGSDHDGYQENTCGVDAQQANLESSVAITPRPNLPIFDDRHMIHKQDTQFPVSELRRDVPLHSAVEMQEEASGSTALQTMLERFEKLVESDPNHAADYSSQGEGRRIIPSHITRNQKVIDWREDAIRSDTQASCDEQLNDHSSEQDHPESYHQPIMSTDASDDSVQSGSVNTTPETAYSFVRGPTEQQVHGKDPSTVTTLTSEVYQTEGPEAATPAGSSSPDLGNVRSETGSGSRRSTTSRNNPRTPTIASVFSSAGTPSTSYSTLYEFDSDNGYDTDVPGFEDAQRQSISSVNRQDQSTGNFEDTCQNYDVVDSDGAADGHCHSLPAAVEIEENSMDSPPREAEIRSRHTSTSSIQSESRFLVRQNTDSELKCLADDDMEKNLPKKVDEPPPRLQEFDWVRRKDAVSINPEVGSQSWMDDDFWT